MTTHEKSSPALLVGDNQHIRSSFTKNDHLGFVWETKADACSGSTDGDIYGRTYNIELDVWYSDGFCVNTNTGEGRQHSPQIAGSYNREFTITYDDDFGHDGSGKGVYYTQREYNGDIWNTATPSTAGTTTNDQQYINLADHPTNEGSIFCWTDITEDTIYLQKVVDSYTILTKQWSGGKKVDITSSNNVNCQVAHFGDTGFVVAWESGDGVYVQGFDIDGISNINRHQPSNCGASSTSPFIAILYDGNYVVGCSKNNNIYFEIFDQGTSQDSQQVTSTGEQPQIATFKNNFVISFIDTSEENTVVLAVYNETYQAAGELFLDDAKGNYVLNGDVSGSADSGMVVATWEDNNEVYYKSFDDQLRTKRNISTETQVMWMHSGKSFPAGSAFYQENLYQIEITYANGDPLPSYLYINHTDHSLYSNWDSGCNHTLDVMVIAKTSCGTYLEQNTKILLANNPPFFEGTFPDKEAYSEIVTIFSLDDLLINANPELENDGLHYTSTLEDGDPLPDWITFESSELKYTITNPSSSLIGVTYHIKLNAIDTCETNINSTTFHLTIVDSKKAKPILPESEFEILNSNYDFLNYQMMTVTEKYHYLVWSEKRSENTTDDYDMYDVYVQRFDQYLHEIGNKIRVNSNVTNNQTYPSMSFHNLGAYTEEEDDDVDDVDTFVDLSKIIILIAWQDNYLGDYDIQGQFFNGFLTPINDTFIISESTDGTQSKPLVSGISIDEDGVGLFEVWWSTDDPKSKEKLRLKDIFTNGLMEKEEQVDQVDNIPVFNYQVAGDGIDYFYLVYQMEYGGENLLIGSSYNGNPHIVVDPFTIYSSTDLGVDYSPTIDLHEDTVIVAWITGKESKQINIQLFPKSADPEPLGDSVVINMQEQYENYSPYISVVDDNFYCLTWVNNANSTSKIYYQIFRFVVNSDALANEYLTISTNNDAKLYENSLPTIVNYRSDQQIVLFKEMDIANDIYKIKGRLVQSPKPKIQNIIKDKQFLINNEIELYISKNDFQNFDYETNFLEFNVDQTIIEGSQTFDVTIESDYIKLTSSGFTQTTIVQVEIIAKNECSFRTRQYFLISMHDYEGNSCSGKEILANEIPTQSFDTTSIYFEFKLKKNIFYNSDNTNSDLVITASEQSESQLPDWIHFDNGDLKFWGMTPKTDTTLGITLNAFNDCSKTNQIEFTIEFNTPEGCNSVLTEDKGIDNQKFKFNQQTVFTLPIDIFSQKEGYPVNNIRYTIAIDEETKLPDWVDYNYQYRLLTIGENNELGNYDLEITGTNECGNSKSITVDLQIFSNSGASSPIVIKPLGNLSLACNEYFYIDTNLLFEDGNGNPCIYYIATVESDEPTPSWFQIDSQKITYFGKTPLWPIDLDINIIGENEFGDTGSVTINIKTYQEQIIYPNNHNFTITSPLSNDRYQLYVCKDDYQVYNQNNVILLNHKNNVQFITNPAEDCSNYAKDPNELIIDGHSTENANDKGLHLINSREIVFDYYLKRTDFKITFQNYRIRLEQQSSLIFNAQVTFQSFSSADPPIEIKDESMIVFYYLQFYDLNQEVIYNNYIVSVINSNIFLDNFDLGDYASDNNDNYEINIVNEEFYDQKMIEFFNVENLSNLRLESQINNNNDQDAELKTILHLSNSFIGNNLHISNSVIYLNNVDDLNTVNQLFLKGNIVSISHSDTTKTKLSILNTFDWSGGTLQNIEFTSREGCFFNLLGDQNKILSNSVLYLLDDSFFEWSNGDIHLYENSIIENNLNFYLNSDVGTIFSDGTLSKFKNKGNFTVNSPHPGFTFETQFYNDLVLEVDGFINFTYIYDGAQIAVIKINITDTNYKECNDTGMDAFITISGLAFTLRNKIKLVMTDWTTQREEFGEDIWLIAFPNSKNTQLYDLEIVTDDLQLWELVYDLNNPRIGIKSLGCLPGSAAETVWSPCIECSPGTYSQAHTEAGTCEECGVGTYSPENGATSCELCPKGTYADTNGTVQCEVCASGTYSDTEGLSYCTECDFGHYQNATGQTECKVCATGSYSAQAGLEECKLCKTGTYQDATGATGCIECGPGKHQNEIGQTTCEKCAYGEYQPNYGSKDCKSCDINAITLLRGSKSLEDCMCNIDYYGNNGGICTKCPTGGVCTKIGLEYPEADFGYWHSDVDPTDLRECLTDYACPGGAVNKCNTTLGYKGEVCSECTNEFYKLEDECEKCPENQAARIVLIFLALFIILGFGFVLAQKARNYFGSFTIGLSFLQIISIMYKLDLKWPSNLKSTFKFASIFNFNIEFLAVDCTVKFNFKQKWLTIMFTPFIFLGLLLFILVVTYLQSLFVEKYGYKLFNKYPNLFREPSTSTDNIFIYPILWIRYQFSRILTHGFSEQERKDLFNNLINAYSILLSLLYLFIALTIFEFFDCTQIGTTNKYFLDSDPSLLCFEGWWWKYFPVAIFFGVLYILGIVLLLSWALWYYSKKIDEVTFNKRFGLLCVRYTKDYYFWEILVMLRKLFLVVFDVFLTLHPMPQVILCIVILFIALILQYEVNPYSGNKNNTLELVLLFVSEIVLFSGLIFVSKDFKTEAMKNKVGIVVIIIIIVSIGIICVIIFFEVRHRFRVVSGKDHDEIEDMKQIYSGKAIIDFLDKKPNLTKLVSWICTLPPSYGKKSVKLLTLVSNSLQHLESDVTRQILIGDDTVKNKQKHSKALKEKTSQRVSRIKLWFHKVWNKDLVTILVRWYHHKASIKHKYYLIGIFRNYFQYITSQHMESLTQRTRTRTKSIKLIPITRINKRLSMNQSSRNILKEEKQKIKTLRNNEKNNWTHDISSSDTSSTDEQEKWKDF
ncbi:repeat outer membrane protein [Anaeramoeba flamelloides]|uniref:Repeat outer membrane protein n=1 Tax=Anaeramoeba flamelloides TaxID=1746091 RepID=A0AAV7YW26_9EUKA|nr:repeat outer membrane protein [Anaeramoeba flamelloides]